MKKQHDKQFKEDAVKYYMDHKELGVRGCAQNLDIGDSTLSKWIRDSKSENGIQVRSSGNYSSDEQKEIARLKRELRDTKDALDVLKKSHKHSGKVTEAIYLEAQNKCEDLKGKRRVSVSGMLRILGVSRSGYNSWLHRLPSNQQKRKQLIKKIKVIYDKSHQNYGAPKSAKEIQKTGEKISERTVGKYMKELEIKAQYVKPYTVTTKNSDFSSKLENILDEQLILPYQTQYGAQILHIFRLMQVLYTLQVLWIYTPEKS